VYGNHVRAKPVNGKFAKTWVELVDSDDATSLGFIKTSGIEPTPKYKALDALLCIVGRDNPELLLQPGKTDKKYRLSEYGYSLLTGDTVTAFGDTTSGKARWLLLGFGTSWEGGGESGVGLRYAWGRAEDFVPLADYRPDNSKADAAWLSSGVRRFSVEAGASVIVPVTEPLKNTLLKQGFRIDPTPIIPEGLTVDDMSDLYSKTGEYEVDFITTDIFLHACHLIFDRMLKNIEETSFAPTLGECLGMALHELEKTKGALASAEGRAAYETARDMFSIPLALLSEEPQGELSPRASEEIASIMKAEGIIESKIGGARVDYSQYRPRGHYTTSPTLERYFRAMNFLGTAGLELFDASGAPNTENLRAAALVVMILDRLGDDWLAFGAPIDFLIGKPDDGGIEVYRNLVKNAIGVMEQVNNLEDGQRIAKLAEDIRSNVPKPLIRDRKTGLITKAEEEETRRQEFRISGKRFTFDAYVMNQLTSPRVGSGENPRNLPEGTDVMAILGSDAALDIAKRNDGFDHYADNFKKLAGETGKFLSGGDTVYALWLGSLGESFVDSGSKQFFYRSGAWRWKKLLTASASWAELKHDTVLYTKQSAAEMGDGGYYAGNFAPPSPRGYVEPAPRTYAALVSGADRLLSFFEKFSLEIPAPEEEREYGADTGYADKLRNFRALCESARELAEKEVAEGALTLEDYGRIKELARSFTASLLLPGGVDYSYESWEDLKMALVSDVATDFAEGRELHVATGTPRRIDVFVNDASGGPRVARGWVYSYYEFPRSLNEGRMTDEEWKKLVYDENSQDEIRKLHPAWYENLESENLESENLESK
ncbi:MAG: DUF3160 domain-containing protein, partial [Synergistaceae bacterium]|nr:DUF3160 domain-containing protein [Synergistaceae bacterium]